jgi:DNA repair protein RadB
MKLPEPLGGLLGELEQGAVTSFYGQPGTGKTNVCLLAALECVRSGGKVLFIDTEGGLSKERASQISGAGVDFLKNVELLEPRTLAEQEQAVKAAEKSNAKLIVLDSAVALYRIEHAELSEGIAEKDRKVKMDTLLSANRSLSRQMSALSKIAKDRNIPVVVTAHAFKSWRDSDDSGRGGGSSGYEMVGGDAMRYWSKTIVHLEKTGKTSERKATIVKHRAREEDGAVKFLLVNDGIKPAKGILGLGRV